MHKMFVCECEIFMKCLSAKLFVCSKNGSLGQSCIYQYLNILLSPTMELFWFVSCLCKFTLPRVYTFLNWSFAEKLTGVDWGLTERVFASQGHLTSIFTASLIDALGDWTCRQQVLVARWSGVVLHVLRGSGNTSLVSVEFISKQIFKCNPSSKPFFYIWAIYGDVAIIHISKKV